MSSLHASRIVHTVRRAAAIRATSHAAACIDTAVSKHTKFTKLVHVQPYVIGKFSIVSSGPNGPIGSKFNTSKYVLASKYCYRF